MDAVTVLTELLKRAQAGNVQLVAFNHTTSVASPDEIDLQFTDLTRLKRIHRTPVVFGHRFMPSGFLMPGKPIEELGVTTEPITGYRDFQIEGSLDDLCLLSRNGTEWPKYKPLIATCVRQDPSVASALRTHDSPNLSCGCGIYSFDNPKHEDMDFDCDVWGEIYGWGETYICDSGYRTEFAYPKSIFIRSYGTKIADRVADAIREQYGVPVYIVPTRDGLTEGDVLEQMIQGIGGDTHNDDSTT